MWLAGSLPRAKRQRSSGRVNYRGSGRLWRMPASMLPIFSFMLGASDVSLFGIMLPLHEVTMFLINRLPGATALLIHTYTNTEVPMLLIFLFGYLARTSSFLFLLFLLSPLPYYFISPFSSCLSFLSLPHSLSQYHFIFRHHQKVIKVWKLGSKGRENAFRIPRTTIILTEMHVMQFPKLC